MSILLKSAKLNRLGVRLLCAAAMAPLAGCGVNKVVAPRVVAQDYHDRHPVVLADASTTIDVFPSQTLDHATTGRIHDFVARYRRFGHGQITLLAPTGARDQLAVRSGVAAVKRILSESGVSGAVYVGTYPVTDANLAAPVRLSFQGVRAKVAARCGQWPTDLASASSLEGWDNTSYWNFGCASQTTLSAQIDDPRDLVAPRGQSPADIETRMRAIGNVRKGADPSTQWTVKGSNISGVGGS